MSSSASAPNPEELLLGMYCSGSGDPEELFRQIYDELRQVARAYMRRERPDHTLQATALVNEAYIRLFDGQPFRWENRKHLFCTLARCMRRVLMDHAKKKLAERHGGGARKIALDDQGPGIFRDPLEFLALGNSLDRLAQLSPRQAEVVDLHWFAGLTEEEIAGMLGVSLKTVKNDWRFAKAWLKEAMESAGSVQSAPE